MEIVAATAHDVPAMLRLMELLAAEHSRLDPYFEPGEDWLDALEVMFLDRLGRRDHYLGVARGDGQVIGMITASLQSSPVFRLKPRAMIENLVVVTDQRRRGVARALVLAALGWCGDRGVVYTELLVAVDNEAAKAFWEACGFQGMMMRLARRAGEG